MSATRTKVAIVITRMDLGGAQQVALETAARLDPSRFEVLLFCGRDGDLMDEARRRLGASLVVLNTLKHPIRPLSDLQALFRLIREFNQRNIDLVHTHSSKAGILGRLAAFVAGVPTVCHTVHGWSFHDFMSPTKRNFYITLEKLMATFSHCLVTVADSLALKGSLAGIGRQESYQTIRAASDLNSWRKASGGRALLKKLGLQGSGPVVGCVANAKEQKCPEDFVRVAARVPGARFVYVGDGPRRAAAESLARRLRIDHRVLFTGWHRDPAQLASGFDLFLLTSLWEGLPCVFAQALSRGLPVVATAVDGAAELVQENVNGYLCQPHDVEAMADRVNQILKDSRLRRRLSLAARKSAGKEYEFEDMVRQHEKLYLDQVLA